MHNYVNVIELMLFHDGQYKFTSEKFKIALSKANCEIFFTKLCFIGLDIDYLK